MCALTARGRPWTTDPCCLSAKLRFSRANQVKSHPSERRLFQVERYEYHLTRGAFDTSVLPSLVLCMIELLFTGGVALIFAPDGVPLAVEHNVGLAGSVRGPARGRWPGSCVNNTHLFRLR